MPRLTMFCTTLCRFLPFFGRDGRVAFAVAMPAHWQIQNCLHWILDVGFNGSGHETDAITGRKT